MPFTQTNSRRHTRGFTGWVKKPTIWVTLATVITTILGWPTP